MNFKRTTLTSLLLHPVSTKKVTLMKFLSLSSTPWKNYAFLWSEKRQKALGPSNKIKSTMTFLLEIRQPSPIKLLVARKKFFVNFRKLSEKGELRTNVELTIKSSSGNKENWSIAPYIGWNKESRKMSKIF